MNLRLLVMTALGAGLAAAAPVIGFSGGTGINTGTLIAGYEFSVSSPLEVTAMGWIDLGNNGLASTGHQVALWTTGGTLLANVSIPQGTAATLDNGFRMVALGSSVLLSAGNYVIAGINAPLVGGDFAQVGTAASPMSVLSNNAAISYVAPRAGFGAFPFLPPGNNNAGVLTGYIGANFSVQPVSSPAPEPTALALAAAGLAAVLLRRRIA